MLKIIIDNNIIRHKNIEKIKNSNILKQKQKGEMNFYACAKIFSQLIPFLRYKCQNKQVRQEVINFFFSLVDNNYIFSSIAEIANREIYMIKTGNYIENFWFDKYDKKQIANIKKNLSKQDNLDSIIMNEERDFSSNDIENAHQKIKDFQNKNRELIQKYCNESYEKIDENIRFELSQLNFNEDGIRAFTNIVKNNVNENINKNERKKVIYNNLYDKLLEFNLLLSFKEQIYTQNKHILIKDIDYINSYYQNYNEITFTKLLIEATKFGYSYKVNNPNKGYDNDWVNDTSYICCATFADILLTDDTKYLKDSFKYIWGNNKKILTLDEFIDMYC